MFNSFNGIILVNKPSGPTSHDVVDAIRKHFKIKKVGHAGTLDTQATGLLIIMVGRGTKLAPGLSTSDKIYEGVLRLGIATDTQDGQGKIISEADFSSISREQLIKEINKLKGDVLQTPPMVSAIKKNGVPLYKLARKGQTVERQPKLIHIYKFELTSFKPPRAFFNIHCSKGVYVRTICADIGEALGCGAHLESLQRMQSGIFRVEDAISLEALLRLTPEELSSVLIPLNRINSKTGQLL